MDERAPRDVVLLKIPFHQGGGGKVRPAVAALDCGDQDFIAAPITSRPRSGEFEMPLVDLEIRWPECAVHCANSQVGRTFEEQHSTAAGRLDGWAISPLWSRFFALRFVLITRKPEPFG